MATYTNLTSLTNVQVGDVVTYSSDMTIDFAGQNVQVELYGVKESSNGGYTKFTLNSNNLNYFYFDKTWGVSLMYDKTQSSTSRTVYYRIAVAGNAGENGNSSYNNRGGAGGGTVGESGEVNTSYGVASTGGGQTSGGTGGKYTSSRGGNGGDGQFQYVGRGATYNGRGGGDGGAGWYTGGGGAYAMINGSPQGYGGAGGSGFVIGQSTTTYPSGYMGGNSSDIAALEAAVSNATLTRGGSTETSGKMVVTILQPPGPTLVGISIASQPTKVNYYTGETFNPSGLVISAIYSDSTTQTLSSNDYTLSTPNMSTAGQKTITVAYEGFTTSFNINVTALVVTSLTLSGNYPTEFNLNDTFSYSGLVVTANYNSGASTTTNNYSVTGPNMSTAGQQTVTVNYTGSDVSSPVSATYTITIKAPGGIKYFNGTDWVDCEVYYYTRSDTMERWGPDTERLGGNKDIYFIPYDYDSSHPMEFNKQYLVYFASNDKFTLTLNSYPSATAPVNLDDDSNIPAIVKAEIRYADPNYDNYQYHYLLSYYYTEEPATLEDQEIITNVSFDTSIPPVDSNGYRYVRSYTFRIKAGTTGFVPCEVKYYNGTGFVPIN